MLFGIVLTTACGVRLSSPAPDDNAMFQKMDLVGDRKAGSELTVTLTLKQNYPVPVRIACYYEDSDRLTEDQEKVAFEERAVRVFDMILPAAPERKPSDEDVPEQRLSFRFAVPERGDYFIACNSPASVENGTGKSFKIRPA